MQKHKILLGLTTTSGSGWRGKVAECQKFNIKEIALFLTGIGFAERRELYGLLENSPVKSIPHVHLRSDMQIGELDYLTQKFQTQVFNIHPKKDVYGSVGDWDRYKQNIFVENSTVTPEQEELERCGGICIDFSHWQDWIILEKEENVSKMEEAAQKFKIGCCHVSAVGNALIKTQDQIHPEITYENYSKHTFSDLKEFDYIKNFIEYLPELISLELENSFAEQLEAKKYLTELIAKK